MQSEVERIANMAEHVRFPATSLRTMFFRLATELHLAHCVQKAIALQ
jgi:hypothetical protein